MVLSLYRYIKPCRGESPQVLDAGFTGRGERRQCLAGKMYIYIYILWCAVAIGSTTIVWRDGLKKLSSHAYHDSMGGLQLGRVSLGCHSQHAGFDAVRQSFPLAVRHSIRYETGDESVGSSSATINTTIYIIRAVNSVQL